MFGVTFFFVLGTAIVQVSVLRHFIAQQLLLLSCSVGRESVGCGWVCVGGSADLIRG